MLTVNEIKNKVFTGDSKEVLREFPSNSVDLVVTSPPYYNLRNYQHEKQIGSETTPQQYINNLFEIFKECKRVLKNTGSIWVNIADSYNDNKSLIGIPERFVLMMQDTLGLIRRNTIIWHKPSCMPSPVKDRFTIDFEYFYFFVKTSKGYYFETQYEPMKFESLLREGRAVSNNIKYNNNGDDDAVPAQGLHQPRLNINQLIYNGQSKKDYKNNGVQDPSDTKRRILEGIAKRKFGGNKYPSNQDSVTNRTYSGNEWIPNENLERIKRTVWSINTPNSTEAHFATYPEELIEIPIKACVPKEICSHCGKIRTKIMEFTGDYLKCESGSNYIDNTPVDIKRMAKKKYANLDTSNYSKSLDTSGILSKRVKIFKETGLTDCGCGKGFHSGIVLDPFLGSGTTAIKAQKLGRSYVGIELNPKYVSIAKKRLMYMISSYIPRE